VLGAFVVVVLTLLGAGCSRAEQGSSGRPPTPQESQGPSAADHDARDRQLAAMAKDFGLASPPPTDVVRWVDDAEETTVIAGCLTEAGFEVTNVTSLGYDLAVPEEQESALDLALYVCTAQYPVPSGDASAPPTEEHIRAVYDFYTKTLAPCLTNEGHEPPPAPSWEKFRADYADGTSTIWEPFADVVRADRLSADEITRLGQVCPEALPADAP